MVSVGDTFIVNAPPRHRWVVVTKPDEDGNVLIVNFTTLTPTTLDRSCVLQPSDYPEFITHPTCIRYNKAQDCRVEDIEGSPRDIIRKEPVLPATLRKIQEGALASDFMKERFQRWICSELE